MSIGQAGNQKYEAPDFNCTPMAGFKYATCHIVMVIDGEEEGCLQWLKEEYGITVFVFVCTWFTILFFF